jgi:hypothetical protein
MKLISSIGAATKKSVSKPFNNNKTEWRRNKPGIGIQTKDQGAIYDFLQ